MIRTHLETSVGGFISNRTRLASSRFIFRNYYWAHNMFSPILYSTNLQNISTKFYLFTLWEFLRGKIHTKKANITVHIEKIEMKIRNNKENFVEKLGEINMVETRGELIDYFQKNFSCKWSWFSQSWAVRVTVEEANWICTETWPIE